MGNVHATTASPPNPPPPNMGGDPGFAHFSSFDEKNKKDDNITDSLPLLSNPGSIEELHRKCKGIEIKY